MLRTCSVCGGIHQEDNMCKRTYKKNSYASKFRNSNAWITKREQIKKRDKYLCQICLKENVYTYNNLQVHHIVPIEKDNDSKLKAYYFVSQIQKGKTFNDVYDTKDISATVDVYFSVISNLIIVILKIK